MVIAILMESDVQLSDDLLEAILDKVCNHFRGLLWLFISILHGCKFQLVSDI